MRSRRWLPRGTVTEMSVQKVLDKIGSRVVTLPVHSTLAEVVKTLAEEGIGAIMLVDGAGRLVGIMTERDVIRVLHREGAEVLDLPP